MNYQSPMNCRDASALVAGYLDDELSEAQAAPLRQHFLDCHSCRGQVQKGKSLQAWFPETPEVAVPSGFAKRVTRMAFAQVPAEAATDAASGQEQELVLQPVGRRSEPSSMSSTRAAFAGGGTTDRVSTRDFVLQLIAVAAVLLVALSISLRGIHMPTDGELQADDGSLIEALQGLDELNRGDAATGEAVGDAIQLESEEEKDSEADYEESKR
ncbi:MAG: anti-sigma factor RsiW [Planctomycetota bacterium]|jgi:anti-sigma factor RsiW